jgi:hypothetical protein
MSNGDLTLRGVRQLALLQQTPEIAETASLR